MYLKSSCPKCGGGFFYRDEDEQVCITCGFIRYPDGFVPMDIPAGRPGRSMHDRPNGVGSGYGKQGHLSLPTRGERARSG